MAKSPLQARADFPQLSRQVGSHALLYLDSAATSQMPSPVLEAMDAFERSHRANVHRGMHMLAEEATDAYEGARETVRRFVGAAHADEIVFTKSCTEAINIVARGMDSGMQKGDVIALSMLEHHSNIVPWMQLKERTGVTLQWMDINDDGSLNEESLQRALDTPHLRLVAITGMSNVLGTRPDLHRIITAAHARGAQVLVDAAQLIAHDAVDVQSLDVDYLAFSGHKLFGPTGIGVLYAKRALLKNLPPLLGGGNMIEEVTLEGFTTNDAPLKFEAGTPPITQAVGLAAAMDWLEQFPLSERRAHERMLYEKAIATLSTVEGLRILGSHNNEGVISFVVEGVHPHDLTSILGQEGVCLRAGHHCTQPLHRRLGITASTRLSLSLYNTCDELERLPEAITQSIRTLS